MPTPTQKSAVFDANRALFPHTGAAEANGAVAATPPTREAVPPGSYPYPEKALQRELDQKFALYETLEPGWDLRSADPTNLDSLADARSFLETRPKNVPLPSPKIGSDGIVGLYWRTGDTYASVAFEGNGLVSYYTKQDVPDGAPQKRLADDCPLDNGWPAELLEVLGNL